MITRALKRILEPGQSRYVDDLSFEIGAPIADILATAEDLFGSFSIVQDDEDGSYVQVRRVFE